MKKQDFILIGVLLIIALSIFVVYNVFLKKDGKEVVITLDNAEYTRLDLDKDQELEIRTEYGYNKIVISDGKVYVSEADCYNHTCIKQGKIHMTEQSIVCLPHKLIININ